MDTSKIDLTNNNQKLFAGALLVGVLFLLYWVLPPLVMILANIYLAIGLAVPLVLGVLNRVAIWNYFKQISWNLTKVLISGDKLGYMYRYHDYLLGKIEELNKSIQRVGAAKTQLTRRATALDSQIKTNKESAISYESRGAAKTVLSSLRNKIAIDSKQLEALMPRIVNIESQVKALQELHELWLADTEDLKYTLDAKAEEYKLLKEINEATGSASAFLKGNSVEYQHYQESLKQIEESVSTYTANLENFERQARPMIDTLSMERAVSEDAGARLIEEFKKNSVNLRIEE